MRRSDPLIVGGGPAGAAAAIVLAEGGARPFLFERQAETGDALCGGFMSWRTLETLGALGVADPGGHAVHTLRILAGGRIGEAALPKPAIGVSRQRLDALLLARAERAGAIVERGIAVRDWFSGRIETSDGRSFEPDSLFLATGKHDLRGLGRPRPQGEGQTLGLRTRLGAHPALERLAGGAIELHLFDRGYCGLVLQEGGRGNLCLAVRKARLADACGDPETLLRQWAAESPAFADRLAYREGGVDAIGAVPYGWIARHTAPGVFRLGDQAAVIPSLAGEGNGIALASGILAARARLAWRYASDFQRSFARAARRPVWIAGMLWHLAERPKTAAVGARIAAMAPWLAAQFADWTRIHH